MKVKRNFAHIFSHGDPLSDCTNYVIAYSAMLKAVDEFVRMRKITRSVKVALKCLIAVVLVDVDLPH